MLARVGLFFALIAAALSTVGCMRADGQPGGSTPSYGALAGRITRGPTSPVSGPGVTEPAPPPVAGAELKIVDAKGALIATARSDGDGLYRVSLPPGQYRVERGAGFTGATRNLPSLVSVSPGQETRLDIVIDTGIR